MSTSLIAQRHIIEAKIKLMAWMHDYIAYNQAMKLSEDKQETLVDVLK